MQGIALGEAGRDAMARELLQIAGRDWDREPPELRKEFRGYIDRMVDSASKAEETREAQQAKPPPRGKGVLP